MAPCAEAEKPQLLAGTAHVELLARQLTGEEWDIHTLIPPGMCPGHYDAKPSDIAALAEARLIVLQTWQQPMAHVRKALKAASVPGDRVTYVPVDGNWMVPPVRQRAIQAMSKLLSEARPESGQRYMERAEKLAAETDKTTRKLRARFEELRTKGLKVICNTMQEGFVRWAGFEVVDTYGRPEDLSVAEVQRLITLAREAGVALVVDNLQSGDVRMGGTMAREAGAVQVVLNNFPGARDPKETWTKAVEQNAAALETAVNAWRTRHE